MLEFAVIGFLGQFLLAQYPPSTAPGLNAPEVCVIDIEKKLEDLADDGERIVRAILNKDKKTLLGYFSKDGVTLGADFRLSKIDIETQLRSETGLIFATFFDTRELRKRYAGTMTSSEETDGFVQVDKVIMSLHDYFKTAKALKISVQLVTDLPIKKGSPVWAVLSLQWKNRPPKGVYHDPIFICTDMGWKFATFFNTP